MEHTFCTICNKAIQSGDYPTKMHLSWEQLNSGRYSDEVCCQMCYTELSNAISRTIHKVKYDMRREKE